MEQSPCRGVFYITDDGQEAIEENEVPRMLLQARPAFRHPGYRWIKEVEMVHSLDEFKTSRSVYGKDFPNIEMLDAKIASSLIKIIQNFQFKKKVSLEEHKAPKEDWFLGGRQIAIIIYDYFRVTGAHDTVLDYADLFSVTLHIDNVQEIDTRWDEVLLSMSKSHLMTSWKVCTN